MVQCSSHILYHFEQRVPHWSCMMHRPAPTSMSGHATSRHMKCIKQRIEILLRERGVRAPRAELRYETQRKFCRYKSISSYVSGAWRGVIISFGALMHSGACIQGLGRTARCGSPGLPLHGQQP